MVMYKCMGSVPPKRHIKHERPADESFLQEGLHYEHVSTLAGFDDAYAISYHLRPPTRILSITPEEHPSAPLHSAALQPQHLRSQQMQRSGDPITGRRLLLANEDIRISRVNPAQQQSTIYRNAGASELLFISSGSGAVKSTFGILPYKQFDYIYMPQGTAYIMEADDIKAQQHLIIETPSLINLPQRYLNPRGQLKLGAPMYERDLHGPRDLCCIEDDSPTEILCKQGDEWTRITMAHHPFDAVGWDGFVYPYTFNALDFEPITGTVHQPPPIHQCFEANGFVVCTFVPRYLDHHPDAIKVPYAHSNVMVDEVLFYVDGQFSSRKGIDKGSLTLHPRGLVHGPHPGTLSASSDAVRAEELAVMIDTSRPLQISESALSLRDEAYAKSWMESE